MKKNMARETILKILQDPLLKARKRGIVVKMICPDATYTPRNYMIVLLTSDSTLYGYDLRPKFAVNLGGDSSSSIGVSEESYIVKPTIQDYFEIWDMYTRYKRNKFLYNT
jgi:hypothetical protein